MFSTRRLIHLVTDCYCVRASNDVNILWFLRRVLLPVICQEGTMGEISITKLLVVAALVVLLLGLRSYVRWAETLERPLKGSEGDE